VNAKYPFQKSLVSNSSGVKQLTLLHVNMYEISEAQCHIHYSPAENGGVLDIFCTRMSG
jgi:hypothetical protein